jgi:hypothetical protein
MNPGCLGPDRLADYQSGEDTPEERAVSAAHLLECEHCRRELAWLAALRGHVEKLPRSVAPTRDLWDGIATRLEARAVAAPGPNRARFILLAAAAVALVLAGSAITALLLRRTAAAGPSHPASLPPSPAAGAPDGGTASLAQLAGQVRALERALPPQTRALVAHHLELIDAAIRESEAALAADSTNQAIRRMLEARYEQRRGLLEQARRAAPRS